MKKTAFLLDMDGTICESRKPMTAEFAEQFEKWMIGKTVYLVSGSDISKITEQVPEHILIDIDKLFCCNGNAVYEYQRAEEPAGPLASYNDFVPILIESHEMVISQELEDFLFHSLKYSNYSGPKFPPHVEVRTGLLNFSIIGRGCSQNLRDEYDQWNKRDGELARVCTYINEKFPQYTARQGGQISIDVVEKGRDKSLVLSKFDLSTTEIVFYGDKCIEGNDKPLCDEITRLQCGSWMNVTGPDMLGKILFPLNAENEVFANEKGE